MMIGKQAIVGFVLGVGVTAIVLSALSKESRKVEQVEVHVKKSPERPRISKALNSTILKSAILETKIDLLKSYGDKRKEKISALSDEELRQLVKSVEADADFLSGMDYSAEALLTGALTAMAEKNVHGMVQWVQGEYPPKLANKILKKWFQSQEIMPKREAFDLVKDTFDKETVSALADHYLVFDKDEGGLKTANAVYYIESMILGGSSSGTDAKFSDDFEFGVVADAAINHIKSNRVDGQSDSLPGFPTNFFKEWVKMDRDAAFNFYEENLADGKESLPFAEYVDLVEGYVVDASESESVSWLSGLLSEGELKNGEYKELMRLLVEGKLGGVGYSEKVFNSLGDPEIVKAEIVADGMGRGERYDTAIKQFDSFEDYLVVAERAILGHSPLYKHDYKLVQQMQKLERPQSEIDRMKALFKQARSERFKMEREERRGVR